MRIYDKDGNGGFEGAAPALINGRKRMVLDGDWQFRIGNDLTWAKPAATVDRYLFDTVAQSKAMKLAPLAHVTLSRPKRSR